MVAFFILQCSIVLKRDPYHFRKWTWKRSLKKYFVEVLSQALIVLKLLFQMNFIYFHICFLTGWQFSSGAIVWLPPNPKTNPHLDPNSNPNWGQIFLGGNCLDTVCTNCTKPFIHIQNMYFLWTFFIRPFQEHFQFDFFVFYFT